MRESYLKAGKVPEKILQRLIFSQKGIRREEVLMGPMLGEDCAAVAIDSDEIFLLSSDPITATEDNIGYLAVHITLNDLAAAGAEPIGLMITILLPPKYPEAKLESIFHQLHQTAGQYGLALLGGHTEVTDAVNRAVISMTGVAKIKKDKALLKKEILPGDSIVMTKYVGLEGTAILAEAKAEELKHLYSEDFIERAKALSAFISVLPESKVAMQTEDIDLKAMHDVTEGGVLGALWELSVKAEKGLEIQMEEIPILQETVEVTEFFDINPYKLISSGTMLMVATNGKKLVEALKAADIPAQIIGHFTDNNDKILCYSGVRQSILPPEGDELYKVL